MELLRLPIWILISTGHRMADNFYSRVTVSIPALREVTDYISDTSNSSGIVISIKINGITKSDEPRWTTLSRHASDLEHPVYIIKIPAEFHLAGIRRQ